MTLWNKAGLRRGHNELLHRSQQCSKTTLTVESPFHISTPLGIEPGSLMMGSKGLTHYTSETVCECSEIAGSPCFSKLTLVNFQKIMFKLTVSFFQSKHF